MDQYSSSVEMEIGLFRKNNHVTAIYLQHEHGKKNTHSVMRKTSG